MHDHARTICIHIGLRHAPCDSPALDSQAEAMRRRKDCQLTSSFEAGNILTNTKHITGTKSTFNEAHVYVKVVHLERSMRLHVEKHMTIQSTGQIGNAM